MTSKKGGFGDPELDDLLASFHKSTRQDPDWKQEGGLELIKRLRREESERREKETIFHEDV